MIIAGTKIGAYAVERELGRGGMGIVYLARDPRLGRAVAVKALPEEMAGDPQRAARLEREARALAAVKHTNVATVYGLEEHDGRRYVVMEFVEGESLAKRLRRGPIAVDDALQIGAQIAAGLEAAHEAGVVHRDLKPGNVLLTPGGEVKVVDFGLARNEVGREVPSSSFAPTAGLSATGAGVVMGTPGYMSPEQARGKPVDRRTDVWALGCVLFECLSGTGPFAGETPNDAIAAILEREPRWESLPARTPSRVRDLLRQCLQKDPKRRLRDVGDARLALEEAVAGREWATGAMRPFQGPSGWRRAIRFAALAGAFAAIGGGIGWLLKAGSAAPIAIGAPAPDSAGLTHLAVTVPEGVLSLKSRAINAVFNLCITPDGRRIVFVAVDESGVPRLYQRRLEEADATPIEGSERAGAAFLSPDGRWLAFESHDARILKAPLSGGAPEIVCTTGEGTRGGCWLDDATMVVTRSIEGGLWRVSENGGEPTVLTELDRAAGELSHRWPEALPGALGVLFVVKTSRMDSFDDADIWVFDLKSGTRKKLVSGGSCPRFVPDTPRSGLLFYNRRDRLWAATLDLATLSLASVAMEVWADVPLDPSSGNSGFAVARDAGTLLYMHGTRRLLQYEPVWVDPATGAATPLGTEPAFFSNAAVGPAGEVAVCVASANDYIALVDDRGVMRRLTRGYNLSDPLWTPTGDAILATDNHGRVLRIPIADPDRIEPMADLDRVFAPTSWSPDAKLLLCTRVNPETNSDIWVVHTDGSSAPEPLVATVENEEGAVFSPDGLRIAYTATQNGVQQVFVRPFPGPGPARQVSLSGGYSPIWSADGRELYFRQGKDMLAVPLAADSSGRSGAPRVLFSGSYLVRRVSYANPAKTSRLLMIRPMTPTPGTRLDVVLNWLPEIKRRMAASGK